MKEPCIFCQIVRGELPGDLVYEDDDVVAFHDINPQAPVHLLIIPKRHVASFADLGDDDKELLGNIMQVIRRLAEQFDIDRTGYRVVTNSGRNGGQVVFHLHFHLVGGEQLGRFT